MNLKHLKKQKDELDKKLCDLSKIENEELSSNSSTSDEDDDDDDEHVNDHVNEKEEKEEDKKEYKKEDKKEQIRSPDYSGDLKEDKKDNDDNELEGKILKVIQKNKKNKILKQLEDAVKDLMDEFFIFCDDLLFEYENKDYLSNNELKYINEEYLACRKEFETEFNQIKGELPAGVDFNKSLYKRVEKMFNDVDMNIENYRK
jgi:hypothetical protein